MERALESRQQRLVIHFGLAYFVVATVGAPAVYVTVGLGLPYWRDPYVVIGHALGLVNAAFALIAALGYASPWVRRAYIAIPATLIGTGTILTAHYPYGQWVIFFMAVIPLVAGFVLRSLEVGITAAACLGVAIGLSPLIPLGAAVNGAALLAAVGVAATVTARFSEKDAARLGQQAQVLAARNHELGTVIDASKDAMLLLDEAGRLATWNEQAGELLREDQPARGWRAATGRSPLARAIQEAVADLKGGESVVDCEVHGLVWNVHAVRSKRSVVVTIRDRTQDRLEHRRELSRVEQDLKIEQLEDTNAFKSDLIETASRELNSPLIPLRLQIELLRAGSRGPLSTEQMQCLRIIDRATRRISTIVQDLTDVAAIAASGMHLEARPVALDELVQDQVQTLVSHAENAGVRMEIEQVDQVWVAGDAGRLGQALTNLLDNAVKFARGGLVRVGCQEDGEHALVWVSDNGVGIARQHLDQVFEPFTRFGGQETKGAGLGLYIAKGIITSLGGEVGIDSHGPGRGTTVWFRLPLSTPAVAQGLGMAN